MIRILLVGKNGQIGWELLQTLGRIAVVIATDRHELDVTSRQDVFRVFKSTKPDLVINATGYNDVDGAEADKENAVSVNVAANTFMAAAACQLKAFYLTYSTDYVFDGKKKLTYVESDQVNPLNVYGQTKLDGEKAIVDSGVNFLILRTSSVFSLRRPCFLTSFLKRTQQAAHIQVRSDLVSSPTSARYLAEITTQIISLGKDRSFEWLSERKGVYHLAGTGAASRFEWAREIRDILKLNVDLLPSTYSDYPLGAERPIYSALDSSRFLYTFGLNLVPWEKMLKYTLKDFYEEK
jgi:dTDP-4-dehydrorhamnose reductase